MPTDVRRLLTFQADFIPLERLHRFLEQPVSTCCLARDVVLLPFDRYFERVEDLLHGLGDLFTNTIAGNESDREFACYQ